MNEKPLLIVKNLVKTYGQSKKTTVLKSVNLTIKKGSFNWVVGQSGSGKTTLLNLMTGLDMPTSGEIYIDGVNFLNLSEKDKALFRANNLGFIFQFHYLLPEYNAYQNVLMPIRIQRKKVTKDVKQRALKLMDSVGILHVLKHYPNAMSGGEQQRCAVARALMGNPKLVIADEPTGNLDSESAKAVYDLIRSLHDEYKITFIIVTHDNIKAKKNDRIITLKDGMIIKDVTIDDIN